MKDVIMQGLPPVANADMFPQCRDRLNQLLDAYSPEVVFTHSPDDSHPDHYALSRFVAMVIAERNRNGEAIELLCWEPGSCGPIAAFNPNVYIELSAEDITTKQNAIDGFTSQFPEGQVDNFAAERAAAYGKVADVQWAEAFRRISDFRADPWMGETPFIKSLHQQDKPIIWRL